MHPRELSIHDFTYSLPEARIAQHPLAERDASMLLVYRNGHISERIFHQLPELLDAGDLLVFNETRVVHARLIFHKGTGGQVEIFCLEPYGMKETAQAFAQKRSVEWVCLVGNAKRWKQEVLHKKIDKGNTSFTLAAERIQPHGDSFVIRLSWDADLTFAEVIQHAGLLPLPPYMKRDAADADEAAYQTVYGKEEGSVAAPTAGLHFTDQVFAQLKDKGVETSFLTLHVGAGTFRPVKAEQMKGHDMHEERIYVPLALLEKLIEKAGHRRIIAVGTTSLRTLESLYWFGVKLRNGHEADELFIDQWEVYNEALQARSCDLRSSLEAVREWMQKRNCTVLSGSTKIIIAPPYSLKVADALVTNFHQPESTLLLLVAAAIGPDWRKVYDYALAHGFRFLSYGDSSILFRPSAE